MANRSGKMENMVMENLFNGIYKNKKVLITGHTGFKGSWLTLWLQLLGAKVIGYSTKNYENSKHFEELYLDCINVFSDVRDEKNITNTINKYKPDIIFHLAAQSLVRESYLDPITTYQTNVLGTLNVFEAAKNCSSVKAIINVTTDKVYENREWDKAYKETEPLGGYDPYSSSKACSEILSSSYRRSFFIKGKYNILLATARAGNVIGGGDWAKDRLIPDIIRAVENNQKVFIRNPDAIRPWQHVLEPLSGYLLLGHQLFEGKSKYATAWNFGPNNENCIEVQSITKIIKEYWNKVNFINNKKKEKLHEAKLLKIDSSKAMKELNWLPVWNLEKTIKKTIEWYSEFVDNHQIRSLHQLEEFVNDAKALKLTWCNYIR